MMGKTFTLCFSICIMSGLPMHGCTAKAAHPEPSVLVAAAVNSFLNRSKLPNPILIISATAPPGFPPPLPAGAMFSQKVVCKR